MYIWDYTPITCALRMLNFGLRKPVAPGPEVLAVQSECTVTVVVLCIDSAILCAILTGKIDSV